MTDNDEANRRIPHFSQPPAVPYADAMTQLTRRIEELEKRTEPERGGIAVLASFSATARRLSERLEELYAFADNFRTRIGELETRYGAFGKHNDVHNALNVRIEKLEARLAAEESSSDVSDQRLCALENGETGFEERDRQDRWWDTYNASRGTAWRNHDDSDEEFIARQKQAHDSAVYAADRAHGPLEAKGYTFADISGDARKFHLGSGGPALTPFGEQVQALVKAAKGASTYCRDCGGGGFIMSHELDRALKPFEQP